MRFSRLSECFGAHRTGYSVHRSLPDVAVARPRGLPMCAFPTSFRRWFILSQAWTLYRDLSGCRRVHRIVRLPSCSAIVASSHEVSRPFSDITRRVGLLPGSTRAPPSAVFLRPSRALSSSSFAALFHAAATHGVIRSSGLFPTTAPLQPRQPVVPSRRFSSFKRRWPRPQGFASCGDPYPRAACCSRPGADALPSFQVVFMVFLQAGLRCLKRATEAALRWEPPIRS
jgi:hypothetical protein